MDDVDKVWEVWSGLPASPQAWTNWKPSITAAKQPVDEQGQQWGHPTVSVYMLNSWVTSNGLQMPWVASCWDFADTYTHTHNTVKCTKVNNFETLWERRETWIFCASFLIPAADSCVAGRVSQPPSPWEVCPKFQQIPESEAPGGPSMEQEEACGDDSSETSEDCVLCLCKRLCIIVCMVWDLPLPPFSQGDLLHFNSNRKHDVFLQVLRGTFWDAMRQTSRVSQIWQQKELR